MYEDEANKSPVDPIKSFNQINFENESTEVFLFDGVKRFLYNSDRLSNLAVFKEPKLLGGDTKIQKGLETQRSNLAY